MLYKLFRAVANGYCKLWLCYCRASAITVVVLLPAGSPVENLLSVLENPQTQLYYKPHNQCYLNIAHVQILCYSIVCLSINDYA